MLGRILMNSFNSCLFRLGIRLENSQERSLASKQAKRKEAQEQDKARARERGRKATLIMTIEAL